MRALLVVGWPGLLFFLQQMVFVGNVERSQDREANGVDGVGGFGDGANFCVHVFSELQDVFRVGAAQIVGLIARRSSVGLLAIDLLSL